LAFLVSSLNPQPEIVINVPSLRHMSLLGKQTGNTLLLNFNGEPSSTTPISKAKLVLSKVLKLLP